MASATLIPVSEYLNTSYRPDCDYVDGVLQERNGGERPHGVLQTLLAAMINANRRAWGVLAVTELRVQISAARYRIPDICVLRRSDPVDVIVHTPPLICIEILSPRDTVNRMQEKIEDYVSMGVENIWTIDPISRHAWIASPDGSQNRVHLEFTVPGTSIRLSLTEVSRTR